jgi:hypothetical protein
MADDSENARIKPIIQVSFLGADGFFMIVFLSRLIGVTNGGDAGRTI